MDDRFTYEEFLYIMENADKHPVDETSFYFGDDPKETEHCIGWIQKYEKPYRAGYCDIPDGCEYGTAKELPEAEIFDGRSIKDRWEQVVFADIGGIDPKEWIRFYTDK